MGKNSPPSFKQSLFRRKRLDPDDLDSGGLARVFNFKSLIFFGVGGIVGTGLFSITGIAASENAGPAVILAYFLSAFSCVFIGLCYGELASLVPASGSSYAYTYAAMGEFMAWVIGWNLVLEYSVGAATVAVSWSHYLDSLLRGIGISLPPRLLASPFEIIQMPDGTHVTGLMNLPATFIIVTLSLLLMSGLKESIKLNNIVVFVKLFVIACVIIVGLPHIKMSNYTPFIPANTGTFGHFGWTGVMQAAGTIFFAYIGFDAISSTSQEAKNPTRDIPISLLIVIGICALIYVSFSFVLVGMVNYKDMLNDAAPVATAIDMTSFPWLKIIIKLSVLFGFISVLFLLLVGQTRIFFAMAKDGLLPPFFSKIHSKYQTPWYSHMFFMIMISFLCAFLPISQLSHMCSIGALSAFLVVCIGVMILRRTHPNYPRKFRVPGGDIIPILGTICCLIMLYSLDSMTWSRMILWLSIGIVIYFVYGRYHSRLHKES